jgi:hypothetical protein
VPCALPNTLDCDDFRRTGHDNKIANVRACPTRTAGPAGAEDRSGRGGTARRSDNFPPALVSAPATTSCSAKVGIPGWTTSSRVVSLTMLALH